MTDLGAGVHEHDEEPINGRVGPAVPRKVTCPACGLHDSWERSTHPDFPYLCGACWTLFTGTELEWRRHRVQREEAIERRKTRPASVPPMRSHKTDQARSLAERLQEHE